MPQYFFMPHRQVHFLKCESHNPLAVSQPSTEPLLPGTCNCI